MSDPNRLGNGNNGDSENNRASSFEINWDDILKRAREFDALRSRGNGDLLDDASDNNVEPLKSSKVNTGDDFEEVDLSSAGNKTTSYSERLSALLGYDNTGIDDSERVHVGEQPDNPNNSKDTGKDDSEGVAVGEQPDNPNDSKDTGKDGPEDDEDNDGNNSPESVSNKGNIVRNIMDRFKKNGIGKLFVRGCLVAALVGAIGGAYHRGFYNGAANTTAKMEANINEMEAKINEMEAKINSTNESQLGSDGATKELDRTATATESNAEKLETSVDLKIANGDVIEGVDFRLGGDNSGADMLDFKNMDSSHAGAFTSAYADWINGGAAAEYKSTIGNEEATNAFHLKTAERMNSRMGNVGLLSKSYFALADFEDKNMINQENMGENAMRLMQDPVEYERQKAIVEQKNIELAKKVTYDFVVLERDKDIYCSEYMKLYDQNGNEIEKDSGRQYSAGDISRVEYITDTKVNPVEGGALVRKGYDNETGLDYVESHPEVKEQRLRSSNLIKPGATDKEIQWAMSHWVYEGELVVCGQDCWVKKVETYDSSVTYKAEYKTPEKSSSTSTYTITPVFPEKPDPKLDDGSGIHKEEDDGSGTHKDEDDSSKKKIHRIYRGGNHHDDSSGIHESDKKKDDETPGKTPDKPSETPDKPGETPDKPGETPKDNEKVLEAKTDIVHVSREDNLQKDVTVSNQTDNVLLDHVTESMPENVSGDEVVDNTAAGNAAVDLYEATNENGVVDNDKSISTASGSENLNTGATEKQSDAEGVNKVEEVKESAEKVPDTSYDLDYASAEWDFSNFGN